MTGHDILKIAATVAIAQASVDLLARWLVFSTRPYQQAVSNLERAQVKRDKVLASAESSSAKTEKSLEKQAKKIQRAEDDCAEAASLVAARHTAASFYGSIVFIILYRILSIEYSGRVIAVLPFSPGSLLRRLTQRGFTMDLEWTTKTTTDSGVSSVHQACGFLFIYILCTMSVKFVVNKLVGVAAPRGADGGVSSILAAPQSQKMMKSLGVDTDQLSSAT